MGTAFENQESGDVTRTKLNPVASAMHSGRRILIVTATVEQQRHQSDADSRRFTT